MEALRHACGVVGIYAVGARFITPNTPNTLVGARFITPNTPGNCFIAPNTSDAPNTTNPQTFASSNTIDVRRYLTLALTALQHRGQESAGMAVYDDKGGIAHRVGMGKVREVFPDSGTDLPFSYCGIGHVRYSTTGSSCVENAGPFVVGISEGRHDALAVAHNGNLTNGNELRTLLPQELLQSTTDSEAIALLLLQSPGRTLRERMLETFPQLKGAYSLVMLSEGKLYAMRDPWGMRPLCVGRIGEHWIVASESGAIDRVGGTLLRQVEPGELITIDEQGMRSELLRNLQPPPRQALCVFEYIYFSDATSELNNRYVYTVREALGRELAREHPVEADIVTAVPDTAIAAAVGYARASGIDYDVAIIKNRYSDRSFIKPDQRLRQLEVDLKFNLVKPKIEGKRLVIVDDSIVRGNTMKRLVAALRRYGAKEIHLRSSAPPMRHPCYFGVDIPQEAELVAAGRTVQEVADYIGVDTLGYLSVEGLGRAIHSVAPGDVELDDATARQRLHSEFCYGCMERGGWPYDPLEQRSRLIMPIQRDMVMRGQ